MNKKASEAINAHFQAQIAAIITEKGENFAKMVELAASMIALIILVQQKNLPGLLKEFAVKEGAIKAIGMAAELANLGSEESMKEIMAYATKLHDDGKEDFKKMINDTSENDAEKMLMGKVANILAKAAGKRIPDGDGITNSFAKADGATRAA